MAAEADLQKQIIKYLRRRDCLILRINGGRRGRVSFFHWWDGESKSSTSGAPDVWALTPWGKLLMIECKAPDGKERDEQVRFRVAAGRRNALVITAYTLEDVTQVVEAQAALLFKNGQPPEPSPDYLAYLAGVTDPRD